ncbi:MAG: hypothetical protein AAB615_03620 [Patescibacteria group bacterium]
MEEKKYTFLLHIGREHSKLSLLNEAGLVVEHTWEESRDMGRRLFEAISAILKEQNLSPKDVSLFEIETEDDVLDSSTSKRIAETVQKVYTFSVSRLHSSNQGEGR